MTLFYDTETTGLPQYWHPSAHPSQPHLVEVGALLVDDAFRVVETFHAIVKPMGWVIPAEVTRIHGITNAIAEEIGIPEAEALDGLLTIAGKARGRVAYNEPFDARIVRIACKRHRPDMAGWWADQSAACAMALTRKLTPGKIPTLSEAYLSVTGKPLKGAHSAAADAKACMEVLKALHDGAAKSRVKPLKPIGKPATAFYG